MVKLLQIVTLFCICILQISAVDSNEKSSGKWPSVRPFKESIYFADAANAAAKFNIIGIDGKPLYAIDCHTANYEGDPDFDYSGDFECRLKSLYSRDAFSTLFTENPEQKRDWESRGRFLVQEIIGQCADYPEYGRIRHFKLRKMEITLSIRNPEFEDIGYSKKGRPKLKSFSFDIEVKSDQKITGEITEPVPYLEPPQANPNDPNDFTLKCDVILRKKER